MHELSALAPEGVVPAWLPAEQLAVVLGVVLSVAVLVSLARPRGQWGTALRRRFVLGVPWGTLLAVAGVLGVYAFVQAGFSNAGGPVVIPFRSWSYFYPLGVVTASFAHAGLGHLVGNLVGTLAFAPVAEYAWGHYPTGRGTQTFTSLRTNPYARILVVPVAVFAAGLVTSAFALGPVIGFSGVVFAFAGFALVRYPVTTLVAVLGGRVIRLVQNALRDPRPTAEAGTRFVTPWWSDIAIQGHALGLLLGVVAGALLARRRGFRPDPARLWFATLVFAVVESLWAVYWFRGGGRYVLFRAAGTVLVFVLAALVAAAITASDRPLVARIDLDRREAAAGLLGAVLLALALVAVPFNLVAVADSSAPGEPVQVRDYEVTYAEDVENQLVSLVNVSAFGETTQVSTSGVIVVSERRTVWQTVVSKGRLAHAGRATVRVGGLGWRQSIHVNRTGWSVAGDGATYKVFLRPAGGSSRQVYAADPARAEPVLAGHNVSIRPTDAGFDVVLSRDNETVEAAPVPANGTSATLAGVRFTRRGEDLYGRVNDTRVRVASRDTGE